MPSDTVKSTQKALIVVAITEADPKSAEGQMLDRMLSAVGLDRSGCRMVEGQSGLLYRRLESETTFELLLAFGYRAEDLGLQILFRQCERVQFRGRNLIFCPSLAELAQNQLAKKTLWESLKSVFPPAG